MTTLTNDQITAGAAVLPPYKAPDLSRHALDDGEKGTYQDGHRAGWRAAEAALRARAPSPQIAEVAELPSIDTPKFQEVVEAWRSQPYGTRDFLTAWDTLVAHIDGKFRDAIAASRRASSRPSQIAVPDGTTLRYEPRTTGEPGWLLYDRAGKLVRALPRYDVAIIEAVIAATATPAPASAGQAAPVVVEPRKMSWTDSPFKTDYYQAQAWAQGWNECLAAQPAEGAGQAGQVAMPTMRDAFRTEVSEGQPRRYYMRFEFPTLTDLDKAGDEWHAFVTERAAAPADPSAARLEKFIDWYLRAGKRMEIDPHGHIRVTTREHIINWLDGGSNEGAP